MKDRTTYTELDQECAEIVRERMRRSCDRLWSLMMLNAPSRIVFTEVRLLYESMLCFFGPEVVYGNIVDKLRDGLQPVSPEICPECHCKDKIISGVIEDHQHESGGSYSVNLMIYHCVACDHVWSPYHLVVEARLLARYHYEKSHNLPSRVLEEHKDLYDKA